MDIVIKTRDAFARNPALRLAKALSVEILEGEQIAIVGDNGSGKSLAAGLLASTVPCGAGVVEYGFASSGYVFEQIKVIEFRDSYGASDDEFYYQQRWNSHDAQLSPTVSEALGKARDLAIRHELIALFDMEHILTKRLVMLSSGELRKFMLLRAMQSAPRVLVIDNPFIGLDSQSRELLSSMLTKLAKRGGVTIILQLSSASYIPSFISHVLHMRGCVMEGKYRLSEFISKVSNKIRHSNYSSKIDNISLLPKSTPLPCPSVVSLRNVSLTYGKRTIFKNINWEIQQGERWALLGRNGSGKSSLLSLITADNPQSYAMDISLFNRKRGTGESIWDIKRNIGYLSVEMCRAFIHDVAVKEVVAGGLYDTKGAYYQPKTQSEVDDTMFWMDIFGISHLAERSQKAISSGEQRLVMLARAFVRNPQLLILDEPLHGLDDKNRDLVRRVVEAFSYIDGKSLIIVSHYNQDLPPNITHTKEL